MVLTVVMEIMDFRFWGSGGRRLEIPIMNLTEFPS